MSADPLADVVQAMREASERMIVRPNHAIISERVAAILVSHGAKLSDRVTVILSNGADVNGLDFAGTRPERRIHIDTPKPLGKRAKRRAKGKRNG